MHGLLSKGSNNSESLKYPTKNMHKENTEAKGREQRKIKQYIRNTGGKNPLAFLRFQSFSQEAHKMPVQSTQQTESIKRAHNKPLQSTEQY